MFTAPCHATVSSPAANARDYDVLADARETSLTTIINAVWYAIWLQWTTRGTIYRWISNALIYQSSPPRLNYSIKNNDKPHLTNISPHIRLAF